MIENPSNEKLKTPDWLQVNLPFEINARGAFTATHRDRQNNNQPSWRRSHTGKITLLKRNTAKGRTVSLATSGGC